MNAAFLLRQYGTGAEIIIFRLIMATEKNIFSAFFLVSSTSNQRPARQNTFISIVRFGVSEHFMQFSKIF